MFLLINLLMSIELDMIYVGYDNIKFDIFSFLLICFN